MYVLGIDGGGTKTIGVIANSQGEVLCKAIVGSSNMNSVTKSAVIRELTKLFEELKTNNQTAFSQVTNVFAGMAGVRDSETKQEVKDVITSILKNDIKVTVDNDAMIALYSGTLGKSGIVQIAGTGAITYGENDVGKRGRVGGWGHLFSDHGSGYAIGKDGLNVAFNAYDGMIAKTYIETLLLKHFKVNQLSEIIPVIYRDENPKKKIATLSKLVVEAAEAGDKEALNIIHLNGRHLGDSIATLIKRLFGKDYKASIPVVLTGGIFNLYDLLEASILQAIPEEINVKIILPKVVPVSGAIIAAFKQENVVLTHSFMDTFKKQYK